MLIQYYHIVYSLHSKNTFLKESQILMDYLKQTLQILIEETTLEHLYENADLSCIFIQSGGTEQEFLKIYERLKPPVYLLTLGTNNSLAASMEILSFLKSKNCPAEIIHGSLEEIALQIKTILSTKKVRFGVIGKPSDWLIASQVDYKKVKERFSIELIDISIQECIDLVLSYNHSTMDLKSYSFPDFESDKLQEAFKVYLALKQIIQKYNLQGITVRCFDLLKPLNTTSCLAFALLNQEGIIATCEGDIPSMITMYILKKVTNQIGFQANPCRMELKKKQMTFAHCTLPLNMVQRYAFKTHFESNIGVAIQGTLQKKKVTIFKISNDLTHYFVAKGKIVQNLDEKNLCRTQIVVQFKDKMDYFLKNPYGNHHLIVYGNYYAKLKKEMKKLKEV